MKEKKSAAFLLKKNLPIFCKECAESAESSGFLELLKLCKRWDEKNTKIF